MTQAFEIPRSVSRNVVRDLVLSASTGALDAYAVGGFEPEFVADFSGSLNSGTEYYRSGGSDTTFSSVFTHSGLVLPATMTDSDGDLKWAPHNILDTSSSTDFTTNAGYWNSGSTAAVSTTAADPDGGSTALEVAISSGRSNIRLADVPVINGVTYEFRVWVRQGASGPATHVRVMENNTSAFSTGTSTKLALTSSWQLLTHTITGFSTSKTNIHIGALLADASLDSDCYGNVQLWGWHFYRSDLGGMVNNPDRGDSYVPTTTAARFLPRRNHYIYNGSTYDNAGILIESAAATNLLQQSNAFTTSPWVALRSVITPGATTGPDGVSGSATSVTDDAGGSSLTVSVRYPTVTVATSTAYTFSVYAKANLSNWIALYTIGFTTPGTGLSYFDVSTGTLGTKYAGHSSYGIEDVGGGWYRCHITFTTDASDTVGELNINVAEADGDASPPRDGGESVYIYGAQFEAGTVPSSYIPTSGTTVTRAAETLTVAGANLPYSATAMSFHITGRATYAITVGGANSGELIYWQANSTNYVNDYFRQDDTPLISGRFQFAQRETTSGLDQVVFDGITPGINRLYNVASRHGSTFVNGAVSGTALTADTTPTALPDLSAQDMLLARTYVGSVALFRMWGTDIGDSGIETAST